MVQNVLLTFCFNGFGIRVAAPARLSHLGDGGAGGQRHRDLHQPALGPAIAVHQCTAGQWCRSSTYLEMLADRGTALGTE